MVFQSNAREILRDCARSFIFSQNSSSNFDFIVTVRIYNSLVPYIVLAFHYIWAISYSWRCIIYSLMRFCAVFWVPRQLRLGLHYYWHYLSHPTPLELPASLVALSIDVKSLTIMSCGGLGGALTAIHRRRRINARVLLEYWYTTSSRYASKRKKNFR